MIRVYTASKLSFASNWRQLEAEWPFVIFHARWLRHVAIGTPDTPVHAGAFWLEDQEDAQVADALIIFARDGEHLRGALVEVGFALSANVPVICVGDHPDYGTWQYHPGVQRVKDFMEAEQLLRAMDESRGESQQ